MKTYYKKPGAICQKISGFHSYVGGFLEEHGIQLLNKTVCEKTGIIIADVLCEGHIEPQKTFYPESWCRKKIIEKTFEALNNLTEAPFIDDRGAWQLFGITQEGIKIKAVISTAGELITAFPQFE